MQQINDKNCVKFIHLTPKGEHYKFNMQQINDKNCVKFIHL
jgi:hypothetical protein